MTKLSVNINKVALLRNARGRDFPNVREFASRCLDFGAHGITLHPRQDQRHARYSDICDLRSLCDERQVELNVEGYPSADFVATVIDSRPTQCTLVPDSPGQLTSDHGWRIREESDLLERVIQQLHGQGIRVSLFVDYDYPEIEAAREVGADRIELYTEHFASTYHSKQRSTILHEFSVTALRAQKAGLGVNAGHDLNLENLAYFLSIPHILEVSIGHALIVECIDLGLRNVIKQYVQIIEQSREPNQSLEATPDGAPQL